MPFPHIQGAFRKVLVADASQCVDALGLTLGEAAMAEPLAVTVQATTRVGKLGKRVRVTGCRPIGVVSTRAAPRAGAAENVAVNLSDLASARATKAEADRRETADHAAGLGRTGDALNLASDRCPAMKVQIVFSG